MKKFLMVGLVLILTLGLCAGALASDDDDHKITVMGNATIKVKPDVAYVTLGVQTEAKDAKTAQSDNTNTMNDVIEAIKGVGIADKDIKTDGFYINPNYNYETQQTTGYSASNSVTVTLRDIGQLSTVIDAAIDAGANNANSVSFNVSEPSPHYAQALKDAVADAKTRGEAIAEALGVKLSLPLEVAEQNNDEWYGSAMGNYNSVGAGDAGGESTPIQSGEIEITARVQVTYGY